MSDRVAPVPPRRTRPRYWMVGAVVGLAFAAHGIWRLVQDDAARDPEARARQIEASVTAKEPALAVVAQGEPAIWQAQHQILVDRLRSHPDDFGNADVAAWAAPLNTRIKQVAAAAGDEAVLAILRAKVATMRLLQAHGPEECRAFVQTDYAALAKLPEDLRASLQAGDETLFAAYREGLGHKLPEALPAAALEAIFDRAQQASGVRFGDHDLGLMSGQGTAAQQCDATIRFMTLILGAPAPDGARVARAILMQ